MFEPNDTGRGKLMHLSGSQRTADGLCHRKSTMNWKQKSAPKTVWFKTSCIRLEAFPNDFSFYHWCSQLWSGEWTPGSKSISTLLRYGYNSASHERNENGTWKSRVSLLVLGLTLRPTGISSCVLLADTLTSIWWSRTNWRAKSDHKRWIRSHP
jgi:hypothetical protein